MTDVHAVLQPADLLIVRTGGFAADMIRLGAALSNKPNISNHVAIFHHWDDNGVPWALEGRPGGVGWQDARPYIASHWTLTNCGQQVSGGSRADACARAVRMLGTRYDWKEIGGDALEDLHVRLWDQPMPHGLAPGEVVCSSFAAWLYEQEGWAHPDTGDEGFCTPADWDRFVMTSGYNIFLGG